MGAGALVVIMTLWAGLVSTWPIAAHAQTGALQSAIQAYQAGDHARAEAWLKPLVLREPNNPEASYYLANCYLMDGATDQAIKQYEHCLTLGRHTPVGKYAALALDYLNKHPQISKDPLSDAQYEERLQRQMNERLRQLDQERDARLNDAARRRDQELKAVHDMVNPDGAPMPKYIPFVRRRVNIPNISTEPDSIQDEAVEKRRQIAERYNRDVRETMAKYKEQCRIVSSSSAALKGGARSTHGNIHLIEKGTNMYVRQYVNFGESSEPEPPLPPAPLRATAGKLSLPPMFQGTAPKAEPVPGKKKVSNKGS